MIFARRFPLDAGKVVLHGLQETIKVTVLIGKYHKFIKVHIRIIKAADSIRAAGRSVNAAYICQRRNQFDALVKKAGRMSFKCALYICCTKDIFQTKANAVRQFIVKKALSFKDHLRSAAAYVPVKRKLFNGLRHERKGTAAVDKQIMSVGLRLHKTFDGTLRNIAGNPARKQRAVNIKKQ